MPWYTYAVMSLFILLGLVLPGASDTELIQKWSINNTGIINQSGDLTVNMTTIELFDDTGGAAAEKWSINNTGIINQSGDLTINLTTIDARDDVGGGGSGAEKWILNRTYMLNQSHNLTLNETQLDTYIHDELVNWDSDGNDSFDPNTDTNTQWSINTSTLINQSGQLTVNLNIVNLSIVSVNLTSVSTYTGNLTSGTLSGYVAGHAICAAEFGDGFYMCNEFEIDYYQRNFDMSGVTGIGKTISGAPKFAPASNPVNDCLGFTNDSTCGNCPLGTSWNFDVGYGVAHNCALQSAIACCKNG